MAKSSDRGEVESDMQLDGGDCVMVLDVGSKLKLPVILRSIK